MTSLLMDSKNEPVSPGKARETDEAGKTFTTDDAFDPNADSYPPFGAVDAAIPKGTIDPVYEAKARVLNHAVT